MRTIVITGASSGIGKGLAIKFASEEKSNLVIAARDETRLLELQKELESLGSKVLVVKTDVSRNEDLINLINKTIKCFQTIDIFVNNAGIGFVKPINELSDEEISSMIDVNVKGLMLATKHASQIMINQRSGRIVNISSIAGFIAAPKWNVYAASKFAVKAFSDSIRLELRQYGVGVTCVHPGPVETEFWSRGDIQNRRGRMISTEQCVRAIYNGIKNNRNRIIVPWYYSIVEVVLRWFPFVIDFIPD